MKRKKFEFSLYGQAMQSTGNILVETEPCRPVKKLIALAKEAYATSGIFPKFGYVKEIFLKKGKEVKWGLLKDKKNNLLVLIFTKKGVSITHNNHEITVGSEPIWHKFPPNSRLLKVYLD